MSWRRELRPATPARRTCSFRPRFDDLGQQVRRGVVADQVGVALSTAVLDAVNFVILAGLNQQFDRPGVLSELYGVTNWDFDFVGHKAQGDWQAACGVTVRVPHLAWVSMVGEAKRDYPASIGYQSPWYREYPMIEDHFARIATVMSRGKSLVRVAVIHPIESYWLCFGAIEQNHAEMEQREREFQQLPA